MKNTITIILCSFLFAALNAQQIKIGPTFGSNAVINMTPKPSGGNNILNMVSSGNFSRSQWRLIYEKNDLAPPQGPIEYAWEIGLGQNGINEDFFSIGRYDFNLDFIFTRVGLVMDNTTLFTGLGETTPDAQLHVFHLDDLNDGSNVPAVVVGEYPGTIFSYGYLTVDQPSDDRSSNIARFRDNGATQVQINRNAGTYQLQVFGDAFASGVWMTSDRKLKTNIQPLGTALESLRQLKPYSYSFKKDQESYTYLPEELQFGLIAQDLKAVYPNLVRESDALSEDNTQNEKILTVNYTGLIPVLIASLQEFDMTLSEKTQEIESLQEENDAQQRQIDELRGMVERLLANQSGNDAGTGNYVLPLEQKAGLSQNYPNPFYQNTRIEYFIPANVKEAKIQVTAADGKVLGTVDIAETGEGQLTIKAGTYPAGTYFYSLVLDGRVQDTKRMVLTQ